MASLILSSTTASCTRSPGRSSARSLRRAVAVRGGRIVAVGSDAEIKSFAGTRTETSSISPAGCCLPGFQDGHIHPASGGLERTRCDLNVARRRRRRTWRPSRAYAAAHPDAPWILGGGWSMEAFPGGCPTAAALDAVVGDRPVFLPNRDHHSAWVNTAALRDRRDHRDTPDPADGRIERDCRRLPERRAARGRDGSGREAPAGDDPGRAAQRAAGRAGLPALARHHRVAGRLGRRRPGDSGLARRRISTLPPLAT